MKYDFAESDLSQGFEWNCLINAYCNATGEDYNDILKEIKPFAYVPFSRGIPVTKARRWLKNKGWIFHKYYGYLDKNKLTADVMLVAIPDHLTCIKKGKIYDKFDCQNQERKETKIEGYYEKEN